MTAVRTISACRAMGMEMAGDWEKVQDVKVGEGPNHMGWLGPQDLVPLRLPLPPILTPDSEMLSSGLKRQPETAEGLSRGWEFPPPPPHS